MTKEKFKEEEEEEVEEEGNQLKYWSWIKQVFVLLLIDIL